MQFSAFPNETKENYGLRKLNGPTIGSIGGGTCKEFIEICNEKRPDILRFGGWSVSCILRAGSLENFKRELDMLKLGIIGLSEISWPQANDMSGDVNIIKKDVKMDKESRNYKTKEDRA